MFERRCSAIGGHFPHVNPLIQVDLQMPDGSTSIDGSLAVTTVRTRDWKRAFIGFSPVILLIAVLHLAFDVRLLLAIALSCFGMALFWIWMRRSSLGFHVQGMKQLHAGAYNAAIVDFEKSLSYFHSHPFLDRQCSGG